MTLGQRIQQIRIEHGLSQEEFAEKLGTTRQTVSRWELDQTYPEVAKIVLISRIFLVSTDSILKDGISTFDTDVEYFTCGVYRGINCEIVETEKFALMLYCSSDKNILGAKLYKGYENKKSLVAVCERDLVEEKTKFAYLVEDSAPHTAITNSELVSELIDKGIKVYILNIGIMDNTPASKLIRNVFFAFAEFERDMIVERTQEGKTIAKQNPDFKEGRPKKYSRKQIEHALELLENHSYKQVEDMTGISKSTLIRAKKEIKW